MTTLKAIFNQSQKKVDAIKNIMAQINVPNANIKWGIVMERNDTVMSGLFVNEGMMGNISIEVETDVHGGHTIDIEVWTSTGESLSTTFFEVWHAISFIQEFDNGLTGGNL